jgi:mannose-6-phosphate isomerase
VPDDFDGHRPEDWLASTTHLFAEGGGGVSRLADGADLTDVLAADPEQWLGSAHVAAHGVAPGLLTKLLDSGERLPVHAHPDRTFAAAHLDCDNGKTEAWIVLDAEPGATVWLGFRDGCRPEQLAELVDAQDERLLGALNPIEVHRGDAILVPAGQPHAIGEGILVLELQEPTDLSVMLEHERFGLEEAHAFLGLDRGVALQSVDLGPLTPDAVQALRRTWTDVEGAGPALPAAARDYFRAQVVRPSRTSGMSGTSGPSATSGTDPVTVEAAFAVTVVVEGRGTLWTEAGAPGGPIDIARGDVLLVPHAAGGVRIAGNVTAIRCMPPDGTSAH